MNVKMMDVTTKAHNMLASIVEFYAVVLQSQQSQQERSLELVNKLSGTIKRLTTESINSELLAACVCLLDAWRDLPDITKDHMGHGFRSAIVRLVDVLAWNSHIGEKTSVVAVQEPGSG